MHQEYVSSTFIALTEKEFERFLSIKGCRAPFLNKNIKVLYLLTDRDEVKKTLDGLKLGYRVDIEGYLLRYKEEKGGIRAGMLFGGQRKIIYVRDAILMDAFDLPE